MNNEYNELFISPNPQIVLILCILLTTNRIPNQDERQAERHVYASKICITMALSNNAPILYKSVQWEQLLRINYKKPLPYV